MLGLVGLAVIALFVMRRPLRRLIQRMVEPDFSYDEAALQRLIQQAKRERVPRVRRKAS